MATANRMGGADRTSDRVFPGLAVVMALVVVAGFSLQLAMGRSSFEAPLLVHAHAVVFMAGSSSSWFRTC